jgi:hypothetical protein
METNTNAAIINALASAVLANASNDHIRDEAAKRGLATGITLKAVEEFLIEAMDTRWEDMVAIAKLMPLAVMLEEMDRRDVNAARHSLSDEELLEELKRRGKMDAVLLTDEAIISEVENRLNEDRIPDADLWLWGAIRDKDTILENEVSNMDDQLLWDAIDDHDCIVCDNAGDLSDGVLVEAMDDDVKARVAREWAQENMDALMDDRKTMAACLRKVADKLDV